MADILIDFDGTVVTHEYPNIGKDIGAIPVLKALVSNGHRLILFTMRSGDRLIQAIDWFNSNEIPLYGVNKHPTQDRWTSSTKCHGDLCIDDRNLGTPLRYTKVGRPYVNWYLVHQQLIGLGLIDNGHKT